MIERTEEEIARLIKKSVHTCPTEMYKTKYGKSANRSDNKLKYPTNVLYHKTVFNRSKEKVAHPTQKPVALLEYLIKTYTLKGETVLDFTIGSGSTAVAAINTSRKFIGIEQDEKYCDTTVKRIEDTMKNMFEDI